MRRALPLFVAIFTLTWSSVSHVGAWGFTGHKLIMGRAIGLLPPEIRPFFESYRTTIVEHAIDPDTYRTMGFLDEPPRHFLDMDAYGAFPFPALPHDKNEAVAKYGVEFVTKNGLLFIAATTYDNKFHVYDKLTGTLLWETTLPAAGNATPSLYVVNGRAFIVIACGGGKNDAPSGGTYVAFALPAGS